MQIHPTALVSDSAVLGENCSVDAYAIIEAGVVLGKNCRVGSHAVVREGTVAGDDVFIDSYAAVGGEPQIMNFERATKTGVKIGDRVVIREGVTISRASEEGDPTLIGDDCYLMAQSHVAHDCVVGKGVIICHQTKLGGHVEVRDKAFLGGGAAIHQFCRIGTLAMVAANAMITADVPPYVTAAERSTACGLNLVGLRRANFEQREISDLKRCYRAVFFGGGNLRKKAMEAAREHEFGTTAVGVRFLSFFESGRRGYIRSENESN